MLVRGGVPFKGVPRGGSDRLWAAGTAYSKHVLLCSPARRPATSLPTERQDNLDPYAAIGERNDYLFGVHSWMLREREDDDIQFIACTTPQNDFYGWFDGDKASVAGFYRTLQNVRQTN